MKLSLGINQRKINRECDLQIRKAESVSLIFLFLLLPQLPWTLDHCLRRIDLRV